MGDEELPHTEATMELEAHHEACATTDDNIVHDESDMLPAAGGAGHYDFSNPLENFSHNFDSDGKLVNPILANLLQITELKHDGDLNSISQAVCNKKTGWFRNGEREDVQTVRFDKLYTEILEAATKLGFAESYDASGLDKSINYDIAMVHGSTPDVRFASLIKAWEAGIRFKEIAVVTTSGVAIHNDAAQAADFPPTEMGYMQYIFNNLINAEGVPETLKAVPVKWVDTPTPDGMSRAHTQHTIVQLVREVPLYEGANIIAVSNQPFTIYQNKIVESVLEYMKVTGVKVHNLGDGITSFAAAIMLDSIAKAIQLEAVLQAIKAGNLSVVEKFLKN